MCNETLVAFYVAFYIRDKEKGGGAPSRDPRVGVTEGAVSRKQNASAIRISVSHRPMCDKDPAGDPFGGPKPALASDPIPGLLFVYDWQHGLDIMTMPPPDGAEALPHQCECRICGAVGTVVPVVESHVPAVYGSPKQMFDAVMAGLDEPKPQTCVHGYTICAPCGFPKQTDAPDDGAMKGR